MHYFHTYYRRFTYKPVINKAVLQITLLLILTSCLQQSENHAGQPFTVTTDTIYIQLRDSMRPAIRLSLTHAVKLKDHYYVIFDENRLYSSDYDKHFYIISEDGNICRAPYPLNIESYYADLFVKNDSILFKDYYDGNTYHFDPGIMQWTQIPKVEDIVYEDDRYYITSRYFGEWGYLTWFRNKITGREYELGTFATCINRVDSSYYITDPYRILRIDDPTQLVPTTPERSYYNIFKNKRILETYTQLQGAQIIYQDTTFRYDEWMWELLTTLPSVSIITSFTYNNKLFQLCQNSDSLYVASLDNGNLIPMQYVDRPHSVFNWHNSYRMSIQTDGSQLLKFQTEDPNLFGFIGIHNNRIDIRYLRHDIDSIPYLGKENFPAIFSYLLDNPDSLYLSHLCRIEQEHGATNLQSIDNCGLHESYYSDSEDCDINQEMQFLHVQDTKMSCISEYYYTKGDSLVRTVSFTWTETVPYKRRENFYNHHDDPERIQLFQNKVDELTQYLTSTLQTKPQVKKEKRNHTFYTLSWKSDRNMKVELYYTNDFITRQEIRIVIYY